jgi:DNA processing protein
MSALQERSYWLGFSLCPGIGPGKFTKLLARFDSAEKAWHASAQALQNCLGPVSTASVLAFRDTTSLSEYEVRLQQNDIVYLPRNESEYPESLRALKFPPIVLFTKGNTSLLRDVSNIGVVGTRKVTEYGKHVTQQITGDLVDAGCGIVSGLALGVDALAHQVALTRKGKTIAVLGCGIDCCSPRENQSLYDAIVAHGGVIVSEYGLGVEANRGTFPARNRIIAGLSQGILVTEGAADSGALITAKDAITLGKTIFAVPGPVTSSLSQGTYQLMKQGAVIVSSGKEILETLSLKSSTSIMGTTGTKRIRGDTKEEQDILDVLYKESLSFDELVKRTSIVSAKLGSIVSLMEMKGYITRSETGFFIVSN